jgi:EF hand
MKKAIFALVGSAMLLGIGVTAVADEPMAAHEQMMKSMDTNGDGKISKEEYMAYYEKMWMSMKKDSNGMVDAKSMMMHHDAMMKDKSVSKDDANH